MLLRKHSSQKIETRLGKQFQQRLVDRVVRNSMRPSEHSSPFKRAHSTYMPDPHKVCFDLVLIWQVRCELPKVPNRPSMILTQYKYVP